MILIHGRSTKPSASAQQRLLRNALINGLNRHSPHAANEIHSGRIKLRFAYYGDINNRLIAQSRPDAIHRLTDRNDEQYRFAPCLPEEPIQAAIDRLAKVTAHDGLAYAEFLQSHRDIRWLDEAASAISAVASVTGLSEYVLKRATADMSQYLLTRKIGSEIRERLQQHLRPSILEDNDICLISHSMGCIVAWDVLWKFSRMSEYRHIQESRNRVALWLTLGCPLGEPGVQANLYDANERGEYRFPSRIIHDWVNIAAEDDFVAHDETLANDYAEMLQLGFIHSITDRAIYNFYVKDGQADPHSFYGYLDHPLVASYIANWILKGTRAPAIDEPTEARADLWRATHTAAA